MGRLMRNILLDFAQFEREMTADRTRDKMQQRAEKGMWNGGIVPYGYSVEAKQLIIHSKKKVREFALYFSIFHRRGPSLDCAWRYIIAVGIPEPAAYGAKPSLTIFFATRFMWERSDSMGTYTQGNMKPW